MKKIPIYVGMDAGGTKTRLVAADGSGRILAHWAGPGANLSLLGPERASGRLSELLTPLSKRFRIGSLAVGIAGAMAPKPRLRLERLLKRSLGIMSVSVLNDAMAVLKGLGAANGNRLMLAVGTGVVAFGLDKRDRLYRVDGWGPLAGDAGSGHWIGRKALEAALASYDGRKQPSRLTRLILQRFGITRPEEQIFRLYQNPPTQAQVAALTTGVVQAARRGDKLSKTLLAEASNALALSVETLQRRMPRGPASLILTGGLGTNAPEVLEGVRSLARRPQGRLKLHSGPVVPEAGGLFLAFGQAGKPLAPSAKAGILKNLLRSNPKTIGTKTEGLPVTESSNPATVHFSSLKPLEMVKLMNSEDSKVAPAVGRALPAVAKAVSVAEKRMRKGGRLIYAGAGTSGRLGVLDASEIPPTFGLAPGRVVGIIAGGPKALTRAVEGVEDLANRGAAEMKRLKVGPKDSVVGLSVSGGAAFVLGAIQEATRRRAATVGITGNPASALVKAVDIPIVLGVGPEVITGSSRLKAGTAQKMVLNMLSTCVMARLGYVTGNLMTRVATTNRKLRGRAVRIVAKVLNVPGAEAEIRLKRAGWKIEKVLNGKDN